MRCVALRLIAWFRGGRGNCRGRWSGVHGACSRFRAPQAIRKREQAPRTPNAGATSPAPGATDYAFVNGEPVLQAAVMDDYLPPGPASFSLKPVVNKDVRGQAPPKDWPHSKRFASQGADRLSCAASPPRPAWGIFCAALSDTSRRRKRCYPLRADSGRRIASPAPAW